MVPALLSLLLIPLSAHAEADLQARIASAQAQVLPATLYIRVEGKDFEEGESKRQLWSGSGVVVSTDGFAVTNHHVVERASRLRVMLQDGRAFEAKVVGSDEETDLGVIRLVLPPGAPPLAEASFADKTPPAGTVVLALGSPLGLTRSVSMGIVNNPDQVLGHDYNNWIQTDAAINHGNSGGPLIGLDGRIVGINTLGIGGTGLGFAIPAEIVREVSAELRRRGRVERSVIGVVLQALRDFDRDTFVAGDRGVLVAGVEPGSPAEAAGVKPGDILLSAGGKALDAVEPEGLASVRRAMSSLKAGAPAVFSLKRGERALELTIKPRPRGERDEEKDVFDAPEWMLTARQIGPEEESFERLLRPGGVVVLGVTRQGNAAESGLKPRDIILAVDGASVGPLDDLRRAYEKAAARREAERLVRVSVLRRGRPFEVALDFRRTKAKREAAK